MTTQPRILLLIPTTTYRAEDFMKAAASLGVAVTVASEEASSLASRSPAEFLTLDFTRPAAAGGAAVDFAREFPLEAVVAVDDRTAMAAGHIAAALGVPHHSVEAIATARNKLLMRERLDQSCVPQPAYEVFEADDNPQQAARRVKYPCVLKPLLLAGSRGVIRTDSPATFTEAWTRIRALLDRTDVTAAIDGDRRILAEAYIPGWEVAVEGLVDDGTLQVLAIFDKPEPLEGPYFAETIYVTPSRRSPLDQKRIAVLTAEACRTLGLHHGPIHAELRGNPHGIFFIEVAPRSIGGLCSRALRFGVGLSLEELILRQAVGAPTAGVVRESQAAGVLMIPTPRAGVFRSVEGLDEARVVLGIEDVVITVHPSQEVEPLPEGALYLGFAFARGENPERVESALRAARKELWVVIEPRP